MTASKFLIWLISGRLWLKRRKVSPEDLGDKPTSTCTYPEGGIEQYRVLRRRASPVVIWSIIGVHALFWQTTGKAVSGTPSEVNNRITKVVLPRGLRDVDLEGPRWLQWCWAHNHVLVPSILVSVRISCWIHLVLWPGVVFTNSFECVCNQIRVASSREWRNRFCIGSH